MSYKYGHSQKQHSPMGDRFHEIPFESILWKATISLKYRLNQFTAKGPQATFFCSCVTSEVCFTF